MFARIIRERGVLQRTALKMGGLAMAAVLLGGSSAAMADEEAAVPTVESVNEAITNLRSDTDVLWIIVAGALVFFMQCGFGLLEGGLVRSKNVGNTWMKGMMDFCIGSLVFWAVGYGIMFGDSAGGFLGSSKFFVGSGAEVPSGADYAALFFQTAFVGAAATIMAGAMAERLKFTTYLIMTAVMAAFIYPVVGHWIWGNGAGSWLGQWADGKFIDFAGSTVVHSVGGWASLAGCLILGARIGKFRKDGSVNPTPGHSLPLAAVGTFVLWLGWFGFNPGSTVAVDKGAFATVAVTTNLAAAAGAITAMCTIWFVAKKPDISMTLNGALAGLVAITAGCYNVSPAGAVAIGAVGGVLVVLSVLFFDKLRIDDPVGAISVHGANGIWGTLAVGLFANPAYGSGASGLFNGGGTELLIAQCKGVAAVALWTFPVCLAFFWVLKKTIGIRVSREEELRGLDLSEHGNEAYAGDFAGATQPIPATIGAGAVAAPSIPRTAEGAMGD